MNAQHFDSSNGADGTKKLLRFGTDLPQCADCKRTEIGFLCLIKRSGKRDLILCRNCKAKRKPYSAQAAARKATRFKEDGHFEPTCIICNDPNLQILERDHLAGEANSAFVEPLCANHHGMKSDMAETGPMAALRLRDPDRTALALEAAFDLGLAFILIMMAVADGAENTSRAVMLAAAALALVAWGVWNLAADEHFKNVLGPAYDRAIPAEIPR
jgi:hypothetical protein